MKSLDQLKSFSGSATGTMKTFSLSPRPSSDSHSIRSFTNLKITTEKMVKEHASVKGDLEMATTKLKKSMEHIHALEEKLQHAFNENAKFKVKQRGDEKLWKGLESKFSSIKTLCDQLTETLQFLAGQVQAEKLSADSVGLDSLNEQINSLSLKLENAEETIIKCLKELEELKSEREERKNFYRDEQSRQSSLIEEKECFSQHLGRWMHLYPSEAVYDRPFLYEKGWNKKLNYAFGIARDGVHDLTKRYTKKWHEHGVHCIIPCGYYIDSAGGFNNLSFISGQAIQVWVDCDGAAKHINVLLAPIDHAMKPITPLLSRSLDLSPDVEDTMFVGFSASTGTVLAKHYVLGWSFKMNGQAQELNISHLPKLSESPELLAEKNEPNAIRFLKIIGVPLMSICFIIFIIVVVFSLRKRKFAEVLEDWELDYSPHRFEYKYLYTAPNFVQIVSLIYL